MSTFSTPLLLALVTAMGCAQGSGRRPIGDGGRDAAPVDTGTTADSMLTSDTSTGRDTGSATDSATMDTAIGPDAAADGSTPDTGAADTGTRPDTAPPDTSPPGCTSAADCSDGLACNGVERCNAGTCGPGTPLACDDGITCTVDACTEPGSCSYTPDDGACGAGESCDPSVGCMSGCAESPCRLVAPQCGCPGGQGCYVNGAMRACGVLGTAAEGAACSGVTSCRAGNICINVAQSGSAVNICARHCNGDADCAAGALCVYELDDGTGTAVPGVRMCSHVCDPVRQTGCSGGTYCDIYRESAGAMRAFTDCTAPAGLGGAGAFCFDASDCRAGYACLDAGFGDECLHWCEVASGVGCGFLETCASFTTPLVVGGREIGVCL